MSLAERLLIDPDLEPGKLRQPLGEPRLTLCVGERLLAEELVVQIGPIISANQKQMKMGQRLAIPAAEDADCEWLIVNDREALARAAHTSGRERHASGENAWIGSNHPVRLKEPIGAAEPFPRVCHLIPRGQGN
jgi:hypothetical protein